MIIQEYRLHIKCIHRNCVQFYSFTIQVNFFTYLEVFCLLFLPGRLSTGQLTADWIHSDATFTCKSDFPMLDPHGSLNSLKKINYFDQCILKALKRLKKVLKWQ